LGDRSVSDSIGSKNRISFVAPGKLYGPAGQVDPEDRGARQSLGHGQGDRADPRGQVDVDGPPAPSEPSGRLLHHELAGFPGDERSLSDLERDVAELGPSGEVCDGLAPESPGQQAAESPELGAGQLLVPVGLAAQDELDDLFRVEPLFAGVRMLDVGRGPESLRRLPDHLVDCGHGLHHTNRTGPGNFTGTYNLYP
jgi:hypothetical protein